MDEKSSPYPLQMAGAMFRGKHPMLFFVVSERDVASIVTLDLLGFFQTYKVFANGELTHTLVSFGDGRRNVNNNLPLYLV
jgi:hypothetical protein